MEDQPPKTPQISEKRQKILDKAFETLRKARGQIDPALLNKIRRMIASSPDMMKKLGVENDLKPQPQKQAVRQPKAVAATKTSQEEVKKGGDETINQEKNMEVMAKLLALKPQGKDKIIKTIKKASE